MEPRVSDLSDDKRFVKFEKNLILKYCSKFCNMTHDRGEEPA